MAERLLHVLPAFAAGGAQRRVAQIVNHFGRRFEHILVSLNNDFGASAWIEPELDVVYLGCPQAPDGPAGMIRAMAALIRRTAPGLVLTYNWGSMDAVAAAVLTRAAPLIHSEDGFGLDEAVRQKRRRVWTRRLLLRRTFAAVAPSQTLVEIMRGVWRLPEGVIRYIPNGVDTVRFAPATVRRAGGPIVIGTVSQLRPEKRLEVLIGACARLAKRLAMQLLIVGEGPEREALGRCAEKAGIGENVRFLGKVPNPEDCYRMFDIFALSSGTEQMPISVLEAMASGLPVISTDVGDVKAMVADLNRPFVVGAAAYEAALERLAGDGELRRRVGEANRIRCVQVYDLRDMLRQYERLYESALASAGFSRVASAADAAV